MDSNFTSINRFTEKMNQSIAVLNQQIKEVDWNKVWQTNYPKAERAKQEMETLKKPEIKEALAEVFTEKSLVMSQLGEVF